MGLLSVPLLFVMLAFLFITSLETSIYIVKTQNSLEKFKINATEWTTKSVPSVSPIVEKEQLEEALIRYCQFAQAMIIKCQECYLAGNTYCPYPTDAFCQSARFANYNDPNLVWGFLPNNSGFLTDILSAPFQNINSLTDVNQLPLGIRYLFRQEFSATEIANYRYLRPVVPTGTTDACAIEGIVTR